VIRWVAPLSVGGSRAMNGINLRDSVAPNQRYRRRRKAAIWLVSVLVGSVACGVLAVAFSDGSWWYPTGMDYEVSPVLRARMREVRYQIDSLGGSPRSVLWLDQALDQGSDWETVRACLFEAARGLARERNRELRGQLRELQGIIGSMRPTWDSPLMTFPPAIMETP
jgi:hypothetical protein